MIYFLPTEFNCPCCGLNDMSSEVYMKIDAIRGKLGVPLHINSGMRCIKHNAEVGGKTDSMHLLGKALDVSLLNLPVEKRHEFLELVHSEFNGVGIAKTFIHMDIRQKKAGWVY